MIDVQCFLRSETEFAAAGFKPHPPGHAVSSYISSTPGISASQPPDTKALNPTLRIDRGKAASTKGTVRGEDKWLKLLSSGNEKQYFKHMDAESPRARDVIYKWAAKGRYHFRTSDMRAALGVSAAATKLALNRLARKGLIASPARGFYVIVPPEYMRIRCLPAAQFIPALMECKKRPYYVSLLSAAQYHGAAHHRPQVFQVTLDQNRRPISCGAVKVLFYARKRIAEVPVRKFNTPRGTMLVSSAEATAVDLVGYERRVGGLDNVATILSELAEIIDPRLLADAAKTAPLAWGQRLGYILEQVGAADKTAMLKAHIKERAHDLVPLAPGMPFDLAERAADWRLRINTEIEAEV